MNDNDHEQLQLIQKIFARFLRQTHSTDHQLPRDYLERFTQLLNQCLQNRPQLKSTIETTIISIVFPYHSSSLLTFEYQLRLLRYALRQHLQIIEIHENFLDQLFHHSLLTQSSIARHLSLQIAMLIFHDHPPRSWNDSSFLHILELFSADRNLYVRNSLALYIVQFPVDCRLLTQIQQYSRDPDLIYNVLILFDDQQQKFFIEQLRIYETLSDSLVIRTFVLKTARHITGEQELISYLNRLLEKSLLDYVHILLSIITSRHTHQQTIVKLCACVKGLFFYMRETEFEEIDEDEQIGLESNGDEFGELTEHICCQLYERNVDVDDLASIVLDALQPFIINPDSFVYKTDFYSSTIISMLKTEHPSDKIFAQLIVCFDQLRRFDPNSIIVDRNLFDTILQRVINKKRTANVYRAVFDSILNRTEKNNYLESIDSILNLLLFQDNDPMLQWDMKDCALHFLIQLIRNQLSKEFPHWFTSEFIRRIVETFVQDTNEYVQGDLIDFLSTLIEWNYLSPIDTYLTSKFVQLTQYALGDVVRCALAQAWFIILTKTNHLQNDYRFSFETNTNPDSLLNTVIAQIPLLIGDGGHETEIRCARLIEFVLQQQDTDELDDVLNFLLNDGCSNEIKQEARRLLHASNDDKKIEQNQTDQILYDEFQSILHWLDHPDEHLTLDCD